VTTAFILQALAANGEGHLWSIDLPPIGAEEFTGSFVPQHLKSRWTLRRGRTEICSRASCATCLLLMYSFMTACTPAEI
jgi:hypothetical protein